MSVEKKTGPTTESSFSTVERRTFLSSGSGSQRELKKRRRGEGGGGGGEGEHLRDVSHDSSICAERRGRPLALPPRSSSLWSPLAADLRAAPLPTGCSCKCQSPVTALLPLPSPPGCSLLVIKKDSLSGSWGQKLSQTLSL